MRLLRGASVSSFSLFAVSILLVSGAAAKTLPKLSDSTASASSTASSATSSSPSKSATSDAAKTTQTSASAAASSTDSSASTSSASSAAASSSSNLPGLTTSTGDGSLPTGLPKLPGDDYPPAAVPPTSMAPYMQKSTLPEGTIFIGVGAGLAFLALLVLAWRGLVAWSLHRSVRRSAMAHSYGQVSNPASDKKSTLRNAGAPFYSHGPGSALSLDQLGASSGGKHGKKKKQTAPSGSLFFSPTAGTGMHTAASNRNSAYLPAGYYASGLSTPGGASGMTSIGGPQSHGYTRAHSVGPSPPRSPSLPPSRSADTAYRGNTGLTTHASESSLNLSVAPTTGRVPSAYLDDLFDNYPPGHIPGESGRGSGGAGRF